MPRDRRWGLAIAVFVLGLTSRLLGVPVLGEIAMAGGFVVAAAAFVDGRIDLSVRIRVVDDRAARDDSDYAEALARYCAVQEAHRVQLVECSRKLLARAGFSKNERGWMLVDRNDPERALATYSLLAEGGFDEARVLLRARDEIRRHSDRFDRLLHAVSSEATQRFARDLHGTAKAAAKQTASTTTPLGDSASGSVVRPTNADEAEVRISTHPDETAEADDTAT